MRLRFTTRDLLWLTLVAAALFGWWADRQRIYDAANAEARMWKGQCDAYQAVTERVVIQNDNLEKQLNAKTAPSTGTSP